MKPPRRKAEVKAEPPPPPAGERLRQLLAGAFLAVCVGRVLVTSEAASWLGDGHTFTMLLILLAAGTLLVALLRGAFLRPFHLVDAAVAVLVAICVTSATLGVLHVVYQAGDHPEIDARVVSPRPAINMIWEWTGLGLVYFLARQLVADGVETRAVVAVMIALAVVLSALGMYQVFVSLPAERAAYAENPDEVLRRVGQWYPPGSAERARFEDRLNSTEPLATFALANSLAGYLAPWLIMALGVGWNWWQSSRAGQGGARLARIVGVCASIGAMLACLVLTKSRTAYVALALGVVLLPFTGASVRRALNWRWCAVGALVLALILGGAIAAGGLDAEVLTEASKSLGYRLEYWQSTLDMIRDFPLLGVGPGDFQHYYTKYKLPQASEEIRDPHNFLLEIWATAGTFAFLAMVVTLAGFAWQTWQLSASQQQPESSATDSRSIVRSAGQMTAIGGIGGTFVAVALGMPFGFGLSIQQALVAVALGGGVVASLWPWVIGGARAPRLPALSALVLAVHLLAAGGIAFPGVAGTFWILMALGLNQGPRLAARAASPARSRLVAAAGLVIVVVAGAACYRTALLPVLALRAAMAAAEQPELNGIERRTALRHAGQADPFSVEPPLALAQLSIQHLRRDPNSELWGHQFLDSSQAVVALAGHSSAAWRELAKWSVQAYEVAPTAENADRVVQLARGAALMYPNSATVQAEYALALEFVQKPVEARRVAQKALELNARTPHADKQLPADVKSKLEKLLHGPEATPAAPPPPSVVK